eukprot:TRINITY_DN21124_c0_g1_i1.p1 TRINITY_DN21124_c0_g1~~TRINITY_DN21124_c0_g1_i1.p1  ORF type:complete len:158 (-),score=26.54 TRINITY_DN21124_c0_g1_i1:178-651(-)
MAARGGRWLLAICGVAGLLSSSTSRFVFSFTGATAPRLASEYAKSPLAARRVQSSSTDNKWPDNLPSLYNPAGDFTQEAYEKLWSDYWSPKDPGWEGTAVGAVMPICLIILFFFVFPAMNPQRQSEAARKDRREQARGVAKTLVSRLKTFGSESYPI